MQRPRLPSRKLLLIVIGLAICVMFVTFLRLMKSGNVGDRQAAPVVDSQQKEMAEDRIPFRQRPLQKFQQRDLGRIAERVGDSATVMPWDYFVPSYECTRGEDIVGRDAFGEGVWVCGMLDMLQEPRCIVYIVGADDETAFEDDILRYTKCEIHVFSTVRDSRKGKERVSVYEVNIGANTDIESGIFSISDAMDEFHHDRVDFVYVAPHKNTMPVAASIARSTKWIGQVSLGFEYEPDFFRTKASRKKMVLVKDFETMHNELINSGFALVRREENNFKPRTAQMLCGNSKPKPSSTNTHH